MSALSYHLLNKNVNLGCQEFQNSDNYDEFDNIICKNCQLLEYEHKNKIIKENGNFELTIMNNKTKECDIINFNIYKTIGELIKLITIKYKVKKPLEVYYLHLEGLENLESPFQCVRILQLNDLNIDFKCNKCVVTYNIGNKLYEIYYNCCIISLCLPCACFCLPQISFDLVSEAIVDSLIHCTSLICLCKCCKCCNKHDDNEDNEDSENNNKINKIIESETDCNIPIQYNINPATYLLIKDNNIVE